MNTPPDSNINIRNYCTGFVDLLGQREALREQALLSIPETESEKAAFHKTLRDSIGAIDALQKQAREILKAGTPSGNSTPRELLSVDEQQRWDEMQRQNVKTQHWSDGLLVFSNLGDQEIKCHVNSVFSIFSLIGVLCFAGLASMRPLRGAIEIAWATELRPGELYGAAVARAYELESSVASYPRIVVGPEMLRYLDLHANSIEEDPFSRCDRGFAEICRSMLTRDADGHVMLHYLGTNFQKAAIPSAVHVALYERAKKFVTDQLQLHQKNGNSKLAFRYSHLLAYFESHPAAVS